MDNLVQKTYMLAESDIKVIEYLAKEKGLASLSSALRMIIREWKQLKADLVTIPKAGIIIKDGKVELNPEYWNTEEGVEQSR